jgi:hypothetical protein
MLGAPGRIPKLCYMLHCHGGPAAQLGPPVILRERGTQGLPFFFPGTEQRRSGATGFWPAGAVLAASGGRGACLDSGTPDEGLGAAGGSPWWPGHEHQRSATAAFGDDGNKEEALWLARYWALLQEASARPAVA